MSLMQVNGLAGTVPAASAKTTSPAQAPEENGGLFSLLLQNLEQSVEGKGDGLSEQDPNPDDLWDERQAALGVVCALPAPVQDAAQETPQADNTLSPPAVGAEERAAPAALPDAFLGRMADAAESTPPAETAASATMFAEDVQTEAGARMTAHAPAGAPQAAGTQAARLEGVDTSTVRLGPAEVSAESAADAAPAPAQPEAAGRPDEAKPAAAAAVGETGEAAETAPAREEPRKAREVRNTTGFASSGLRIAYASHARTEEAPADASIEPPAGQVASEIVSSLRQRRDSFTLRLTPEGLGEVTVRLAVRENGLRIWLRSESAAASEMIAAQLDLLHTGLRTAGYSVEQLVMENFAQSGFGAATEQFGRNRQPPAFAETEANSRKAAPELPKRPGLRPVYRSGTIHYRI